MWRGPHWGRVSRGSRQLHVLQHEGEREGGKTQSRRSRRGCPRAGAEDAGATVGCGPVAQGSGARRVRRRRLGFLGVETQHGPPRGRLGLHPPLHSLSHLLNLILKNHTFFSWAPSGWSSHAISADFYAV